MTRTLSNPRKPRRNKTAQRQSSAEAPADELDPEEAQRLQERLLDQLADGAKVCQEIETRLRQHPAPELESIIKLHRVLVLKLSTEAQAAPELLQLVSALIKPLMDWARLEEKRKDRELAQQKYQDQLAAERAANEKEQRGPAGALRPETLEKIEHELNLF